MKKYSSITENHVPAAFICTAVHVKAQTMVSKTSSGVHSDHSKHRKSNQNHARTTTRCNFWLVFVWKWEKLLDPTGSRM